MKPCSYKPGAAVFDLDGTLVNSLKDLAESTNYALKTLGYPTHDTDEYRYMVGCGVAKLIEAALPPQAEDDAIKVKARALFDNYYNVHYLDFTRPYDGVIQLLDTLREKGLKIAVVSNKPDEFVQKLTRRVFGGVFDYISGQREGVPRKPDPAGALLASSAMNVKPECCLYLGDSGVDMQTAVAAGMYPVGALWGFRERDELIQNGAECLIKKPLEMLSLLESSAGR